MALRGLWPCTFREIVQEAVAASVPAESETVEDPPIAVAVPVHVPTQACLASPRSIPEEDCRVKATPVKTQAPKFGLEIVKESEVVAFNAMLAAPNAWAMLGGLEGAGYGEA